jgi:hypothetical protein
MISPLKQAAFAIQYLWMYACTKLQLPPENCKTRFLSAFDALSRALACVLGAKTFPSKSRGARSQTEGEGSWAQKDHTPLLRLFK